jgi:hypothetical protein
MNNAEKLQALRRLMQDNNLAAFIEVTGDDHQSEYFADHYRTLEWISNFSGENSTVVVTPDKALIWADGRYWISCEKEIAGTEFQMMKMNWPNVPTVKEFLLTLPNGSRIGFNGAILPAQTINAYLRDFQAHDFELVDVDLIGQLWTADRPQVSKEQAWLHELKFTGCRTADKLADFRQRLQEKYADYSVISSLDDICWLYNIRAFDIPCCPVLLSFALITPEQAFLYADPDKIPTALAENLQAEGVTLLPYEQIYQDIAALPKTAKVYIQSSMVNYRIYQILSSNYSLVDGINISTYQKAVKNPTEIANLKGIFLQDSAAICKFMCWLDQNIGKHEIKELDCAAKLLEYRQEQEGFIEPSFETIAAYKDNAAMLHYSASVEKQAVLQNKSFFLHDSGGQYYGGTTDITRTQAVGPLTEEEIFDYTHVVKGCVDTMSARFLRGTTGISLDGITRYPMWQTGTDYKSGTGHGVGYCLNVHEGPQSISTRSNQVSLQLGMLTTVEPGIYKANKHGIRIENDVLTVKDCQNEHGEFYRFEIVSYVPFELRAIDKKYLTAAEIKWLNDYHQACYEKISPFLNENEKNWLKNATKAL